MTKLINIGMCVTINGKQYQAKEANDDIKCNKCIGLEDPICWNGTLPDCGFVGSLIPGRNQYFIRAKETMKGRRCIKSDFKVGKVIYYVGRASLNLTKRKIRKEDMPDWVAGSYEMLIPFTTRRAAQAYIDSRKGAN
jgi:hypothetical protein